MKKSYSKEIKRIKEMEALYDEADECLKEFENALEKYEKIQKNIDILKDYYTGQDWKDDFELDEEGKLPKDLKRGVLSEDAINDLLDKNLEIKEKL